MITKHLRVRISPFSFKFQTQKTFIWNGVLESNIKLFLEHQLTTSCKMTHPYNSLGLGCVVVLTVISLLLWHNIGMFFWEVMSLTGNQGINWWICLFMTPILVDLFSCVASDTENVSYMLFSMWKKGLEILGDWLRRLIKIQSRCLAIVLMTTLPLVFYRKDEAKFFIVFEESWSYNAFFPNAFFLFFFFFKNGFYLSQTNMIFPKYIA